ncbi:MAG: hypothetical protein NC389_05285 [Acetatifactor muris]|nr:hypothetical protein [Acetatifactor muris]
MKRFRPWWQQDKRYMVFTQAVLLALLPVLCCFVRCALDGETISSVWLPAGAWSDELLYYKQTEGIVHYGWPRGIFDFNEGHGPNSSAVMSNPIPVLPWVIWGLLFGWKLWSPVVCNIVLTSLACFLFVLLVKPAWKQLGILALLFSLYTPFTRYMLSGMPEVLCFDMVILFYALAVNYLERKRIRKLVLLFVLGVFMTLMRPWLLLFLLLPSRLWIRRDGWRGFWGSAAVLGVSLGLCIWAGSGPETDFAGPLYAAKRIRESMVQGLRTGLPGGAFLCSCALLFCILAGQSLLDRRRFRRLSRDSEDSVVRDEENVTERRRLYNRLVIQVHLMICYAAVFLGMLFLYGPEEGGRQLPVFITAGIFAAALMDAGYCVKAAVLSAFFAYLYLYLPADSLYYELPYRQEEKAEQLAEWEETFEIKLELNRESGVSAYDNTVIWALQEETPEEGLSYTGWQLLYALPEGFGISFCTPEYAAENFDALESGYMAVLPGDSLDRMCADAGYREIGRDEALVIYRLR